MALYQLLEEGGVLKTDTNQLIPPDPKNRHWRAYLQWVTEGGVPDPVPTPAPLSDAELLNRSDYRMIRAVDWILETLVAKGVITVSEIPQALKDLYLERKAQRGA